MIYEDIKSQHLKGGEMGNEEATREGCICNVDLMICRRGGLVLMLDVFCEWCCVS